jgi:hypothetical protein
MIVVSKETFEANIEPCNPSALLVGIVVLEGL